ncbi:DNA-repair protein rad13 [Nannizzia gypsea CBS 118893]|uniref:DNA-repair protein rad13 n=1 Tax=Arthroderma gypseum (strain ATCC MYA-4604 / CBS 118893) TaxID=535722 RepID=E4V392_ARTGP|nr:DNA-repair protein rad13 [Nannizzia gypsea CBS 118893]EFR04466.1 DNA-repair protein rad13 [Nannizzia gypsea CBS 118893]
MGVTGLWTVVKPCARPIKLETLNKRRLAIDASIWIYQFLKAVRDKEGNALRNAHIVGFFRRICKLLFFGIKPVFVFDGGAPILKRQTIANRKRRREGRREDAARTASKLLAIQIQRQAEEEAAKRKTKPQYEPQEEQLPDELVYAEETLMTKAERQRNRQFRKTDAYHLPDLDMSLAEMGAPNDPRIMSHEELEAYAQQFKSGENINLYDFSKIDFDGPFFLSLPASDRYNILNAARLRSRLRMGYSKDQLDTMFPDRMAFSRFQIERVAERNNLTQRLMNLNGMNGDAVTYGSGSSRVAGERDREYILVKDNGVEGGWALGVLGNKEGSTINKPIEIDKQEGKHILDEDDDEGEEFEDVPIEGLNRLPKLPIFEPGIFDESIAQQRRMQSAIGTKEAEDGADENTLFVDDGTEAEASGVAELFEHLEDEEAEDLSRAVNLSLEDIPDHDHAAVDKWASKASSSDQVKETEIPNHSDSDDDMEFFSALAKSKVTKGNTQPSHPFSGPLPFEPLRVIRGPQDPPSANNGPEDITAGGFEVSEPEGKEAQPLPPWFTGPSEQKEFISREEAQSKDYRQSLQTNGILPRSNVIDITGSDDDKATEKEAINLDSPTNELAPPPSSSSRLPTSPEKLRGKEIMPTDNPLITDMLDVPGRTTLESPSENFEEIHTPPKATKSTEDMSNTIFMPLSPKVEDEVMSALPSAPLIPNLQAQSSSQNPLVEFPDGDDEYSDPEDDELMYQLAMEAEEHARFASTLNSKSQAENAFDYEQELKQLRSQQKKDRRDADEVSQIMVTECQQLLRLFGLPYITAPMEAEAQCAELVALGLVDGIVTDDSDTFLFGGTRIYKNMFNQSKYVECYLSSDLEKEYTLDRKKLISFSHLLGSDYTEGIPGIGPVTALEILTEFSDLEEFRDWWSEIQLGNKIPDDIHAGFRKKFKKNVTKLFLPPGFPDKAVEKAYLEPEVDPDPSEFKWGVPDLDAVRQFLMTTIGWSPERTDEVLVPVIRDVNRREQEGTQSNITGFFQGPQGAGAFAPRQRTAGKSRIEKAFGRLRNQAEARQTTLDSYANNKEDTNLPEGIATGDDNPSATSTTTKRRARPTGTPADEDDGTSNKQPPRKARKKARDTNV